MKEQREQKTMIDQINIKAQSDNKLLIDCRETIADLCDDNNLPYPVEILHRIGVALGETYEVKHD
jgi:hypothetical protein